MGPAHATPTSTVTGTTGTTATGMHPHTTTTTGTTTGGPTGGIGEKMREGWESVKEAVPGTKEHSATQGTGVGQSGMSTGYTKGSPSDF
jgi:hypothetical protein